MIKGIDAQVMTNRATEYTKDVSQQLRRDALSNEFANRLSKLETEEEMHSVTELEGMRSKKVNPDDSGKNARQRKSKQEKKQDGERELPFVGTEQHLLDIEI